jgi:hypothetical protein
VTADAYVRGAQYAGTNYGRATELIAKKATDGQYFRHSYMKLDISAVQSTTTSVTLRLSGKLSDTRAASVSADIYPVTDISWSETGITWNNKPAFGSSAAGQVIVSGTAAQWYDVDLTTFIKQQRALNRTVITIALVCPVELLPYVSFGSRESSARPELVITP